MSNILSFEQRSTKKREFDAQAAQLLKNSGYVPSIESKETKLVDPMKYSASCIVTDPNGHTVKFSNFVVVGYGELEESAIAFLDLLDLADAMVRLQDTFRTALMQAHPDVQSKALQIYQDGMANIGLGEA